MSSLYVAKTGSDTTGTGTLASPYLTIGKAASLATDGDTVFVDEGVYNETVTPPRSGVTYKPLGVAHVVLDGEGTRGNGFFTNDSGVTRVRVEGFEIKRYTSAGVSFSGTKGVNNGHVIHGNTIHHINGSTLYQYGVYCAYGNPTITSNEIHSVGPGGEAMGVWCGYTHNATVHSNTIYLIRKEGVRGYFDRDSTVHTNTIYLTWCALAPNESCGGLYANNVCAFNTIGYNPKHTNSTGVLSYWGLTTATANWCRFWHNTLYRNSDADMVLATNAPTGDMCDIRNNIVAGFGGSHIWDGGARTANWIVDYNLYQPLIGSQRFYRTGYDYWNTATLKTLAQVQASPGWETNGRELDPLLTDPDGLHFEPAAGPADSGGVSLPSTWGTQVGARGVPVPRSIWVQHNVTATNAKTTEAWRGLGGPAADEVQPTYFLTASPANEWITFDMGSQKTITHFVADVYAHSQPINPKNYRFEVSDDGTSWTTVLEAANPDSQGASFKYELPTPVTTRHIRYTAISNWGDSTQIAIADIRPGQIVEATTPTAGLTVGVGEVGIHDQALTADVVQSVAFLDTPESVEVLTDGAAKLYVSVDGDEPSVGGANTYILPAAPSSRVVPHVGNPVKLISPGAPTYTVLTGPPPVQSGATRQTGTASPIVVTGLVNGVAYRARVRAWTGTLDSVGSRVWSEWSAVSAQFVPSGPPAPVQIEYAEDALYAEPNTYAGSIPVVGIVVDPVYGSDTTGSGDESLPFATLTKALQVAGNGETVWLRTGTYTVDSVTGATARTDYCTVKPYPGAAITLSATWTFGRATTTSNDGNAHCTYVSLEGLSLDKGVRFGWGCRYMRLVECTMTEGGVIIEDGCDNITIEDDSIDLPTNLTDRTGIHFSSGTVADPQPTITNVYIRRNFIRAKTVGINVRGFDNVVIEDNEITGMVYDGGTHTDCLRTFGGGQNLYVRRNKIHDAEALGLFIKDGTVTNAVFENNLVYNITGGFISVEFYATDGLTFVGNTIEGSVLFAGTITDAIAANNIITGQCNLTGSGAVTWAYKDYNVVGSTNTAPGANDTTTLPTFAGVDDFHLDPADTQAKDTGTAGPVGGFTLDDVDLDGLARAGTWDCGCYVA